jgi:hypothetical protein
MKIESETSGLGPFIEDLRGASTAHLDWRRTASGAATVALIRERILEAAGNFIRSDYEATLEASSLLVWSAGMELNGIPAPARETIFTLVVETVEAFLNTPPAREEGYQSIAILLGYLARSEDPREERHPIG